MEVRFTGRGITPNTDERIVDFTLSTSEKRQSVNLDVEARIPQREISDFGYTNLQVTVVARSSLTDVRQAVRLEQENGDAGLWKTSLTLDRRQFQGEVSLETMLTGVVQGVAYRLLARGETWTVVMDEATRNPLQGGLPIKWVDFTEQPELRAYADEPFHIDMEGTLPILYLNKHIDDLPRVLPPRGQPDGAMRALYETVRTGIARTVWLTLFDAALAGITLPEDADDEPGWPQTRWQQDVLRRILTHVYPDMSESEALRRAGYARNAEGDARTLASRAVLVIEREIVRDGTAIRRALKHMENYLNPEI